MKKKSKIYILYACDDWASHASLSVVIPSTSFNKVKRELIRRIKAKSMNWDLNEDKVTLKLLAGMDIREINTAIKYGVIVEYENGEVV